MHEGRACDKTAQKCGDDELIRPSLGSALCGRLADTFFPLAARSPTQRAHREGSSASCERLRARACVCVQITLLHQLLYTVT